MSEDLGRPVGRAFSQEEILQKAGEAGWRVNHYREVVVEKVRWPRKATSSVIERTTIAKDGVEVEIPKTGLEVRWTNFSHIWKSAVAEEMEATAHIYTCQDGRYFGQSLPFLMEEGGRLVVPLGDEETLIRLPAPSWFAIVANQCGYCQADLGEEIVNLPQIGRSAAKAAAKKFVAALKAAGWLDEEG